MPDNFVDVVEIERTPGDVETLRVPQDENLFEALCAWCDRSGETLGGVVDVRIVDVVREGAP